MLEDTPLSSRSSLDRGHDIIRLITIEETQSRLSVSHSFNAVPGPVLQPFEATDCRLKVVGHRLASKGKELAINIVQCQQNRSAD